MRTDKIKARLGTGELTHNFPAGPELVLPAEDSVVAPGAVTVMWSPVTTQFGGVGYQVIVEQEEPVLRVFSADVTADVTSIVIPPSFMRPGVDYKFEVLAIEASGNQTLSAEPTLRNSSERAAKAGYCQRSIACRCSDSGGSSPSSMRIPFRSVMFDRMAFVLPSRGSEIVAPRSLNIAFAIAIFSTCTPK